MNVIPVDELMERILPPDRPRAFVAAFHVCGEAQKKKEIAFRTRRRENCATGRAADVIITDGK